MTKILPLIQSGSQDTRPIKLSKCTHFGHFKIFFEMKFKITFRFETGLPRKPPKNIYCLKTPSPLLYNRAAEAGTVCTSRTDNQSDTGTGPVWKAGRGNKSRIAAIDRGIAWSMTNWIIDSIEVIMD